jgi:hypothetical protein
MGVIVHEMPAALARFDRLAAREGSELRHPFLDSRVVDHLLAMPHDLVAGAGKDPRKPLLRQIARGLLPGSIVQRGTTTDFNPFLVRALFECGHDPRHLLRRGLVREARLLDDDAVSGILGDPFSDANLRKLANWVALEIWLRGLSSRGEEDNGEEA